VLTGKTFWGLSSGAWGNRTGTRAPAPVAKTGQTDCYRSDGVGGTCACGTATCPIGQDGDLERGVAWPSPRFLDNDDGTASHHLTGLIWLQNANCSGYSTFFTDVQSLWYWSSTSCAGWHAHAWMVDMSTGGMDHSSKDIERYVWLVRGGQ
jgi:hypothetical protein